ncbi:MAG: glycosyltransferase family 2 protein [Clostridia bacterium]|nr:glycosyltransferase family 2 protein [Clostridia bacterium]
MKLTIVIPAYNVEKYIKACLDSCLNQDFTDYEIVCVNDGSTDNTASILDEYSEKYPCIKTVHKENGGVSSARNVGMQVAKGEWLWFVDSDDCISPNCLAALYNIVKTNEAELLVFDCQYLSAEGEIPVAAEEFGEPIRCNGTYEVLTTYPTKNYGNGPFFYWFRKDILSANAICFDCEMKYAEDTKFVFEYKIKCRDAVLIDAPLYYYRQHSGSAMHNLDCSEHLRSMKKLCYLYKESLSEVQDERLIRKIKANQDAATKAVLLDLALYIRNYSKAKEELAILERDGLYPFAIKQKGNFLSVFRNKNKKQIAINLLYKIFRFKKMYLALCRVLSGK